MAPPFPLLRRKTVRRPRQYPPRHSPLSTPLASPAERFHPPHWRSPARPVPTTRTPPRPKSAQSFSLLLSFSSPHRFRRLVPFFVRSNAILTRHSWRSAPRRSHYHAKACLCPCHPRAYVSRCPAIDSFDRAPRQHCP